MALKIRPKLSIMIVIDVLSMIWTVLLTQRNVKKECSFPLKFEFACYRSELNPEAKQFVCLKKRCFEFTSVSRQDSFWEAPKSVRKRQSRSQILQKFAKLFEN